MKPILVGYGTHDHATAALRWAAEASGLLDRPLEVVSVFEPTFAEIAPDWYEQQLTDRRTTIEKQASAAGADQVEIHLLEGEPVKTFADFAHSDPNRLVVVGAHSHHGPGELGSGVPAHSLLHHLHSPLAVIHDDFEPLAGGLLVVGVDGSAANEAALRWATGVAESAGARVLAVFAFDPNDLMSALPPGEHPHAEKIRAEVEATKIPLPTGILQKTISIGVAEFPTDADTFWQVVKFADVALYKAKAGGRNRVVRFLPEMWDENGAY